MRFRIVLSLLKSKPNSLFVDRRSISSSNRFFKTEMSCPRNYFEQSGLLKEGHYNLQVGAPGPKDLKKIAGYFEAASEKLNKGDHRVEETLQYGSMPGDKVVCQEIANFLSRQYGQPVDKNDIVVTSGATLGLLTLLRHFCKSSQTLFVENPTYPVFAKYITTECVMKAEPVSMESDGIDVKMLEEKIKALPEVELTARWPFRAALYVIPTHHNPTGCNYSPEKCRKLIEIARKYDILIVCDDVYNALNYVPKKDDSNKFEFSPQRLFAYDNKNDADYKGHVISNGSLSKIIAPGLRLGWYEAPKRLVTSFMDSYLAVSGGGMNPYISNLTAEVLKTGGVDEHVQSLRVAHKERMEAAISIVESKLGQYGVTISHPVGGYFLWIKMPENVTSADVLALSSKTENVTFVKGEIASVCGDFSNYIRLSIAYYELPDIKIAVEALCRCIESVIQKSKI